MERDQLVSTFLVLLFLVGHVLVSFLEEHVTGEDMKQREAPIDEVVHK